jgi:hypothetical protein
MNSWNGLLSVEAGAAAIPGPGSRTGPCTLN